MKLNRVIASLLVFLAVFSLAGFAFEEVDVDRQGIAPLSEEQISVYTASLLFNADFDQFEVVALLRLYLASYLGVDLELFLHGDDWGRYVSRSLDLRDGIIRPAPNEDVIVVGYYEGRTVGFLADGTMVSLEEIIRTRELSPEEQARSALIANVLLRHRISTVSNAPFSGWRSCLSITKDMVSAATGIASFEDFLFSVFSSPVGTLIAHELFDENSVINTVGSQFEIRTRSFNTSLAALLNYSLNNIFPTSIRNDILEETFEWLIEERYGDTVEFQHLQAGGHQRVVATASAVYRNIVHVHASFPSGFSMTGTGFLIAPNVVLTAGHNLFSFYRIADGEWANQVTVAPGRSGTAMPFGTANGVRMGVGNAWGGNRYEQNFRGDWGFITLNTNFHTGGTFFNIENMLQPLGASRAYLVGYPSFHDLPNDFMYRNFGSTQRYTLGDGIVSRIIRTSISGGEGYSGSPLFVRDAANRTHLLGIMVASDDRVAPSNFATALIPNDDEIIWVRDNILQ